MRYIKIYLLVFLVSLSFLSYSQSNKKIDSLKVELERAKEDTNRVKILMEISREMRFEDINEALKYGWQALELSEKLRDNFNIGKSYFSISQAYNLLNNYKIALEYAFKAIAQFRIIQGYSKYLNHAIGMTLEHLGYIYNNINIPDSAHYYMNAALDRYKAEDDSIAIAGALNGLGDIYSDKDQYSHALEYYLKALDIIEKKDSNSIALYNPMMNISFLYGKRQNLKKSVEYCIKSLQVAESNQNKYLIVDAKSLLGKLYMDWGRNDEAEKYLMSALKLSRELGSKKLISGCYNYIGEMYLNIDNYDSAIHYFKEALKISEEIKDRNGQMVHSYQIGCAYGRSGKSEEAFSYLEDAKNLCDSTKDKKSLSDIFYALSCVYQDRKDYQKSLECFEKYSIFKDSILNEQTNNKIAQLQVEYDTEKKDREIENLQTEKKIKDLEIEKNKQELLAQRLEQEKKQQAIDLLTASKKIQELTLTQKQKEIADLVKDQQIKKLLLNQSEQEQQKKQQSIELLLSSQKIKEGEIKLLEKTRQNQALSLSQKQTEIKNRTFLYIGSLIFLLIGVASFIFYYRYNQARQKIATEKKMIQLEQKALQLQMNPHFIFNSLNSINNYIMNNESELASDYLARFSKLMRMILEASRETFISVSRELEILRYYLTLEKVRFKNQFDFDIQVDQKIDADHVAIPPMLIQPYIENAILHGILPSNRKCNILICLYLESDKKMICLVKDNGIGINKSIAIKKEKTIKSHKSVGMNITQERLAVLGEIISDKLQVAVKDISEKENTGTEVKLEMPIKNLEIC